MSQHMCLVAATGAVKCIACKSEYKIAYPCHPSILRAIVDAFEDLHKECDDGRGRVFLGARKEVLGGQDQ